MRLAAALTLGEITFRALERFPMRTAFRWDGGSWSYAKTSDVIGRMQSIFSGAGVKRGDRICILTGNRADAWSAGIAAQGLGVTLSYLHPLASLDEQLFQISDAAPSILVIDIEGFGPRGQKLAEDIDPGIKVFGLDPSDFAEDLMALCENTPPARPKDIAEMDDFCTLFYTGGTTGRSKGVLRRQSAYSLSIAATLSDFEIPDQVQYLLIAPISHVAGAFVIPTLVRGGTIHCQSGYDPGKALKTIEDQNISMTLLVPTMIYKLLDHPDLDATDTSSLELLLYGGAPMSTTKLLAGLEKLGPVFCQLYGQTEVFPITILSKSDHDPKNPELFASCGFPSSSADIRILDDSGNELPRGKPGEICIRSPFGIELYRNLPDVTQETLKDGWLRTGDIAYQDERGYFFIVDRKKDMIVTGGFNVYPRGVEDVLMSDPSVDIASVIGVPDEQWGEAVKAVIVPKTGYSLDTVHLKQLVKEKLGSFQAPKSFDVVDSLPLTPIGKIDKKALRKLYWGDAAKQVG